MDTKDPPRYFSTRVIADYAQRFTESLISLWTRSLVARVLAIAKASMRQPIANH